MKAVTQTENLAKRHGEVEAIKRLAAAGYDGIDLSCFDMISDDSPKMQSNYKEYVKRLQDAADESGVTFCQAHAPFPSSLDDGETPRNEERFRQILRSMEIASLLGVPYIVVHPCQHLCYADNAAYLKDFNLKFYERLIPYARDMHIRVAVENMWQTVDGIITHSTCSTPAEFKAYMDMLPSEWIAACLDVGHANLMGKEYPVEIVHALGKRLACLHVHETGYNADLHRVPFSVAPMDWDGFLRALAEEDYAGDMTYEADNTLIYMPEELEGAALNFMVQINRYLIKRFESFQKK